MSWQEAFLRDLDARDVREREPFREIIEQYGRMVEDKALLASRVSTLEKERSVLQSALTSLRGHGSLPNGSLGGDGEEDATASAKIEALGKEIVRLQEAVSEATERGMVHQHDATDRLQRIRELERLHEDAMKRAEIGEARLERAKEEIKSLQAELAQRQDDLELLQREVQAFRERAESAEAKAAAADHEYAELMKRFMSEKAEAMERVNQLNEEIASHRERLRAAGLNPDTPTGATGAALSESGAAVGGEEPAGAAAADQKRGWASSIFGGLAGRSQSRSTSSVLARSASASSRSRAPSYAFCVPPSAARMVVRAHSSEAHCVAYDETGTRVATGSSDGTVAVWDATTGERLHTLPTEARAGVLAVDLYGEHALAGCTDSRCVYFDLASGRAKCTLTGHNNKVISVAFMGMGNRAMTASHDRTIRLWQLPGGTCTRIISTPSMCLAATLGPSGSIIVSGHKDKGLRAWNPANGNMQHQDLQIHGAAVTSISFARDLPFLATTGKDGTARLLSATTFECVKEFRSTAFRISMLWAKSCMSPDGSFIAAGSHSTDVFLWNTSSGKETVLSGHKAPVIGMVWSPQGNQVASCDKSGTLVVWQ